MNNPYCPGRSRWLQFLVFLFLSGVACSQSSDHGLWGTLQIEKSFSKKFSLSLEQEIRFDENCSQLDELYTEISSSYRLFPGWRIGLGYRFIEKVNREIYYVNHLRFGHRFLGEIQYRYRYRSLTFLFKTRLESELKNVYSSEKGPVPGWDWKNKLEVKYQLMRFEPYAGGELRFQIRDPRHPESDFCLNRFRLFAGVDFSILKGHSVGVYYLIQDEWNLSDAETMYVLGFKYSIQLP